MEKSATRLFQGIHVAPKQISEHLDNLIILDVREEWELNFCKIDSAIHIPMQEVPLNLDKIPKDQHLVIMCHGGVRSFSVLNYLLQNGYEMVYNMDGGIDRWADEVDPNMKKY
ncbi:hypothetical protein EMN47_13245 [Prolixibacteraceae bacterium JC049]|nr:hypothetical protein [Prolixibacteraceae bacterium JC049]